MNLYEFRYWLEGYREGWEDKTCPTKDQWKRILDKLYYDRDQQPSEYEPTIKWEHSEKFYDKNPFKDVVPVKREEYFRWDVLPQVDYPSQPFVSPTVHYPFHPPWEVTCGKMTCDTSRPVTYYNQKQNGSK